MDKPKFTTRKGTPYKPDPMTVRAEREALELAKFRREYGWTNRFGKRVWPREVTH